ncbi:MAG: glycoside hydrolase family 3 N-terminal domain-containing protein [Schleiferiaceae bacterium]
MRFGTFLLLALPLAAVAQRQPVAARVDSVLSLMTLEELVGQTNQYNGFWNATGPMPEGNDWVEQRVKALKQGGVGSVLNVAGVDQVRALQKVAVEETRLGIPLIFGLDVIHGYQTLSPIPLAEAASWDLAAIERSARAAALEATADGINWTFAPMVDISREPRWGRVMEGAGEDPYLGSRIAEARVRGFQGDNLSDPTTLAACLKHFAGYGFPVAGKDYHTTDYSAHTLYNWILPPFEAGVKAGAATVMNAFSAANGIPATGDSALVWGELRGRMGFGGVLVSDWGSIGEMIAHGYAGDVRDAADRALAAGCDIDMESDAYLRHGVELARRTPADSLRFREAARRILTLKFELGLMDDPYRYCGASKPNVRPAVYDMAVRSSVLLKNSGVLPLREGLRVGLTGPMAAEKNGVLGNWRVSAKDQSAQSLAEAVSGQWTYAASSPHSVGDEAFHAELTLNASDTKANAAAIKALRKHDVLVLAVGEHGYESGEGRSRASLRLSAVQQDLIRQAFETGKPVVLAVYAGRPLVLEPWIQEGAAAILWAWQPGTAGGQAVADVLRGKSEPYGRLPMTFPRSEGQIPIHYDAFRTGRPGPKAEVFWSHYTDESNAPAYPFGFGLSYTTFGYGNLRVAETPTGWTATVQVTNTGSRPGSDVVQLYVGREGNGQVYPVKALKAFQRVELEPGSSADVVLELPREALTQRDGQGRSIPFTRGTLTLTVGPNSAEGVTWTTTLNP